MEEMLNDTVLLLLVLIVIGVITKQITFEAESLMLDCNPLCLMVGLYFQSWLAGIVALSLNIAIYRYRIRNDESFLDQQ